MSPIIRTIIIIAIIIGISFAGAFFANAEQVAKVRRENVVITPDTFNGTSEIELGSIVEIKGTPDLLNAITLQERNTNKVISYFVPLKEYGTNFVVEVKKSKLRAEEQTFIGEINGINKSDFEKRIKNVLNKPVELSDEDRAELDPDTIELLLQDTTKEFPNSALLIYDEKVPNDAQVFTHIAFWTFIATVIICNLFRKFIFKGIFF